MLCSESIRRRLRICEPWSQASWALLTLHVSDMFFLILRFVSFASLFHDFYRLFCWKERLLFVPLFIMQLCWLVSCLKHPQLLLQGRSLAPQKQRRRRLKRQLQAVPIPIYHFTSLHALHKWLMNLYSAFSTGVRTEAGQIAGWVQCGAGVQSKAAGGYCCTAFLIWIQAVWSGEGTSQQGELCPKEW